jgi:hypothetical protein
MPFLFSIRLVEGQKASHPNIIPAPTDGLSCALPRVPHFGGKSPTLPTEHERRGTHMGSLGKRGQTR